MPFLTRLIINKDKILDGILLIDVIIIFILFVNFNFYLIILDAVFSSILISGILVDIISNNNENKKQLLKKLGLIFISLPFDLLIIFYSPVMISSNISMVKFLRISKILKLIKIPTILNLIINKKSQQKLERANKKINADNITFAIFTILFFSGICLSEFENIKGLDVIYFICVTFSSVGYGDVVVSTMYGKIIAIIISVLSILGIGFLSAFFLTYVNIDQEKENTDLKNEVNELKGEVNNLKEQNEKIIELLKKELK